MPEHIKLEPREHVLRRPDLYIGSTSRTPRLGNCLDNGKIVQKDIEQSEAQEQLFKEIIGNAADNVVRSREAGIDPYRIEVKTDDEWISVKNYGKTVPVTMNDKHNVWTPEMIFGQMLTGSNFDDDKKRMYIGKNGIGAKATNIFSSQFEIACADTETGKLYRQTWNENMTRCGKPSIRKMTTKRGYTQVRYRLDMSRLGIDGIDDEATQMYGAHCVALSYVCNLPVVFNGKTFQVKRMSTYAEMLLPEGTSKIMYKDDNVELCVADTPNCGTHLSFVNGMITVQGGVHVNAVYKCLVKGLASRLKSDMKLTRRDVEAHVSVFISCRVTNPEFESQSKNMLKRPEPSILIPSAKITAMKKWGVTAALESTLDRKAAAAVEKMTKSKKRSKWGKAEQANFAGTKKRGDTTYMLTEGLSARTWAVKYLGFVPKGRGRDTIGVQPLRGVLPNAYSFSVERLFSNTEIQTMICSIGCKIDVDYTVPANKNTLRYGRLVMVRDPDTDGAHILGLLLLVFMVYFPTLVEIGFVQFMRVPVIRCVLGKTKYSFYTLRAFKREMAGKHPTRVEYFKGLGSSHDHHIREDYNNPNIVSFQMDKKAIETTRLAFHGKHADDRKRWIAAFEREAIPDMEKEPLLPVSHFIDYELIDFSIDHIVRAIPDSSDGFKESQRKVLYAGMKKLKGRGNIKVSQLANYAAEITAYKHGETCLSDTIVNLAQGYCGANNLPVFNADGQFGSRLEGGKDASQPRYLHVSLPSWIPLVYREEDKCLETLVLDEGNAQECETFYPIVPMHVINGAKGIGTAYSTTIPCHRPLDVIEWLMQWLLEQEPNTLVPWYRGFTGEIIKQGNGFVTKGRLSRQRNTLVVEELPIGTWIANYRIDVLERLVEQGKLKRYDDHSTEQAVCYTLHGFTGNEKDLKLESKLATSNMTVLVRDKHWNMTPVIFNNTHDLMMHYATNRLEAYKRRKQVHATVIDEERQELENRRDYIKAVVDGSLVVFKRPIQDVEADMSRMNLNVKWLDQVKMREMTAESIPDLDKRINALCVQRDVLAATPPECLWLDELEKLQQSLSE